jgi:hypothetical protein
LDKGGKRHEVVLNRTILSTEGFEDIDLKKETYVRTLLPYEESFLSFRRVNNPTLLSTFLHFVNETVVEEIIKNIDSYQLIMRYFPFWKIKLSHTAVYVALAISIRIIGLQNKPTGVAPDERPLRSAILEAKKHFKQVEGWSKMYCNDILERLISLEYFKPTIIDLICSYFQSLVFNIGEVCCGDEKLFHFTGESEDIRLCPNKPARIGLWFYQLCVSLHQERSYLLWTKLHHSNKIIGQNVPVSSVVQSWAGVVRRLGSPHTLLVFDSYYLDSTGKDILNATGVKYIGAMQAKRFTKFSSVLTPKVDKAGEYAGLHNPRTSETVLLYQSPDTRIGKKFVMTNAFQKVNQKHHGHTMPIYDHYNRAFSYCDRFNKALYNRSWPFRRGGRNRSGHLGTVHDYFLSCILQNTFNFIHEIKMIPHQYFHFQNMCFELSDNLYQYAIRLNK